MPAPGQGIVAVQVRRSDDRAYSLVAAMNDATARLALAAEQAVVTALGGGCQLPLGVFAELRDSEFVVRAVAASLDGRRAIAGEVRDSRPPTLAHAAAIGSRLAHDLIARAPARSWNHEQTLCLSSAPAPVIHPSSASEAAGIWSVRMWSSTIIESPRRRCGSRGPMRKRSIGPAAPRTLDQEAISILLAEKVREGKSVVRLKLGRSLRVRQRRKGSAAAARTGHRL